jgi:nitrogen-specific signal transduction histidine kinase
MTIPIITHNHDSIRISIDGIVSTYANAVYLAEAYSRLVVNAKDASATVKLVAEELARLRNQIPQLMVTHDEIPEQVKQHIHTLTDRIDTLSAVVVELIRKVG